MSSSSSSSPLCKCMYFKNYDLPNTNQDRKCRKCNAELLNIMLLNQKESNYFAGLKRKQNSRKKTLKNELLILKEIPSHQNVIRYFTACTCKTIVKFRIIITELCDGNLQEYIDKKEIHPFTNLVSDNSQGCILAKNYYTISNEFNLLHQIVQGLQHLHDNNIIHCKLQPDKILLFKNKQNKTVAKIGGFRHSKQLTNSLEEFQPENSGSAQKYKETEYWSNDECLSKASDVFALGVLMYCTLTEGKYPFKKDRIDTTKGKQTNKNGKNKSLDMENLRKRQKSCKANSAEVSSNARNKKNAKDAMAAIIAKDKNDEACAMDTEEKWITTIDMIKHMIEDDRTTRFTIEKVFHHPSFFTDQKKIDFLLKIYQSIKKYSLKNVFFRDEVSQFEKSLLEDTEDLNSKETFSIDFDKLFDLNGKYSYFREDYPKSISTEHPTLNSEDGTQEQEQVTSYWREITGISNVKDLLQGLRNKVIHSNEKEDYLPPDFIKDFSVTKDSYNPTMFLKVFLAETPQLLVHLYECYRGKGRAVDFYP